MNTTRSKQYLQGTPWFDVKGSWLGALALLGTLLLFIGVSLSYAVSSEKWEDQVLPNIYKQLKQQNKVVKSQQIIEAGEQSKIIITCANGEVRQYNHNGQLLEVKDPQEKVTTFVEGMPDVERDSTGALIAKTEYQRVGGKVTSSVRRSAGEIEMKIFDNAGDIAQVNNNQGIKAYSNYQKTSEGRTTGYTEIDMATGKMSRAELNEAGDVTSKLDENGNRTMLTYTRDITGEIIAVKELDAEGNETIKKMKDGQIQETIKNGVSTKIENKVTNAGKVQESTETTPLKTEQGTVLEKVYKQFDDNGRLLLLRDREGEHRYSYVLGAAGRMLSRREQLTPGKASNEKPKDVRVYYDLAGREIASEENGKRTDTSYVLDAAGNIIGSSETTVDHANGRAAAQQLDKKYDGKGHVLRQKDNLGRVTTFEYDSKGNRKLSTTEDVVTQFIYDANSNLKMTLAKDYQSMTFTYMNTASRLSDSKVRIYNSGFVEVTKYSDNQNGQRVSYTREPLDVKTTVYHDRQGEEPLQTVATKFNGRQTITDYIYKGEALESSKESGPQGVTQTKYNYFGKPDTAVRIDQFGREFDTTYTYDGKQKTFSTLETDTKGKTQTLMNEHEAPAQVIRDNSIGFPRHSVEQKNYNPQGILVSSDSNDNKGETVTKFDAVTGLAMETHTIKKHTFPRQTFVYNHYDAGGDMVASLQRDSHGITQNQFDSNGLMTNSLRTDLHGFPRVKVSNYAYVKGEMTRSTTATDRDFSTSNYDRDGLTRDTTRVRAYGFPRQEYTTFRYDKQGTMTSSNEGDINGNTHTDFNVDELTSVSTRDNFYGHAKHQVTAFDYDGDGYMNSSKEVDLKGRTLTQYNLDGLAGSSMRYDKYGVIYGRDSLSYNSYDNRGFMTSTVTRNIFGDSKREMDRDGLTRKSTSRDNFGLLGGRNKLTDNFSYDNLGRLQGSTEKDALGITTSNYDLNGDAVGSLRFGNFGLGMARITTTKSTFNADTGMTTSRVASNAYGTTESLDFDPILGTESKSIACNNVGLQGSRVTTTTLQLDARHGLNRHSSASNVLGTTETTYDTEKTEGRFGVAVHSQATNNYGLGANRVTNTDITANQFHGLNEKTVASNNYGTTTTFFDTDSAEVACPGWSNGTYGLAAKTVANNNYGLGYTRNTTTTMVLADTSTGLNQITQAANQYGNTTNYFDTYESAPWNAGGAYGMVVRTVAANYFGLGNARTTTTNTLDADTVTGLNRRTQASNSYGTTTTYFDTVEHPSWSPDGIHGMAALNVAANNYGLLNARNTTTTTLAADTDSGLNQETHANNAYGDTWTYFDAYTGSGTYGVSTGSHAENHYGLGLARSTGTAITADLNTGLNLKNVASNGYGTTTTIFDADKANFSKDLQTPPGAQWGTDGTYGLAVQTISDNYFGLGNARHTVTDTMDADTDSGLNRETHANNAYGDTWTYFDAYAGKGTYGVSTGSHAENHYGLGAARITGTAITADLSTGLNLQTVAGNAYGTTTTYFDTETNPKPSWSDGRYGMAAMTVGNNNFGLFGTRNTTTTTLEADGQTGLNKRTQADNSYGTTTTYFDTVVKPSWSLQGTYGMASLTVANNHYGIGDTRNTTTTTLDADTATGLNRKTQAGNAYGTTTNYFDTDTAEIADAKWTTDGTYGMSVKTVAANNYGLGAARTTTTYTLDADKATGLNKKTQAGNNYGTTTTYFDTDLAEISNPKWTTDGTYGMSVRTVANNYYGLGDTRNTTTDTLDADTTTGLNRETQASNSYGTTTTYFDTLASESGNCGSWSDGTYGIAARSCAANNYGIGNTRQTTTVTQDADGQSGLNKRTWANNAYGDTWSYFDAGAVPTAGTYGVSTGSHAVNHYGLGAAQTTDTTVNADTDTGLNKTSVAKNHYGVTTSIFDADMGKDLQDPKPQWHTDGKYGLAVQNVSDNYFGLGDTRHTVTDTVDADVNSGLNKETVASNAYGITTTYFDALELDGQKWSDGTYGMAMRTSAANYFGIGNTRQTTTTTLAADGQKGLNQETHANNAYGDTWTYFDAYAGSGTYGVSTGSHAENHYGLGAARITGTAVTADSYTGLNVKTVAGNDYGTTTTYFDTTANPKPSWSDGTYGLAAISVAANNYGLGDTRTTTTTTLQVDTDSGLNLKTSAGNAYGTTTTYFDALELDGQKWSDGTYGMAMRTSAANYFGIGNTRQSTTTTLAADGQTGLNQETHANNAYGDTWTYFDAYNGSGTYGVSTGSHAENNYGLGAARSTGTLINADTNTGLSKTTVAHNSYGATTTIFDSDFGKDLQAPPPQWGTDGTYGLAVQTVSDNYYGLGDSRHTVTNTQAADTNSGLNQETVAHNSYGTTTTYFDTMELDATWSDGKYGMAMRTWAVNNFGIGNTRQTKTITQDADPQTGLNKRTWANNAYGDTWTYFDAGAVPTAGTYGVSTGSHAVNHYGLGAARTTDTTINADDNTGLNKTSVASNKYGSTKTVFDADQANFGTDLQTPKPPVKEPRWTTDGKYGIAVQTVSDNYFGLGDTRHTITDTLAADLNSGLNQETVASNAYGTTTTYFDTLQLYGTWSDSKYGIATHTYAENNFGMGNARKTNTYTLEADGQTGLNQETHAINAYGETYSYFDTGTYGVSTGSHANNNYGLRDTRSTDTTINADLETGLNKTTVAGNKYGSTTTVFDADKDNFAKDLQKPNSQTTEPRWNTVDGTYGLAVQTVAYNYFGLGSTRHTITDTLDADTATGLNKKTLGQNNYGDTTTYFDTDLKEIRNPQWRTNGTYGMAVQTVAANHYGLGNTRQTTTDTLKADTNTGLNMETRADNSYGTTKSWFDNDKVGDVQWRTDGTFGMSVKTVSDNYYGLGDARHTTTWTMEADTDTGLNKKTHANNKYGDTYTYFDTMERDKTTWSNGTYGMAMRTKAINKFGIGNTRDTDTFTLDADTDSGLNKKTRADNHYGSTTTIFDADRSTGDIKALKPPAPIVSTDGTYGIALQTESANYYGIGRARHTTTNTQAVDLNTGLNEQTYAANEYGTTTTYFDTFCFNKSLNSALNIPTPSWSKDGTYGLAARTVGANFFGIGFTRNTTTDTLAANTDTGLNEKTIAGNAYGTTTTYFDSDPKSKDVPHRHNWSHDGTYGMAMRTWAVNNYGLGNGRQTNTETLDADGRTGLNKETWASNDYGDTWTYFDAYSKGSATYGISTGSHAVNHYGLGFARSTGTAITSDPTTGLSLKSLAKNAYGVTTTYFDTDTQDVTQGKNKWSDGTYGMAALTVSNNYYGLGKSRNTLTQTLQADTDRGLNQKTAAHNEYGDTYTYFDTLPDADEKNNWQTWSDGTYGLAARSCSNNNFGLVNTRQTTTYTLDADGQTGLNKETQGHNAYGDTWSYFDAYDGSGTYGVSTGSHAENHYGLGLARSTGTAVTADVNTGLNLKTVAGNGYGWTTTIFDADKANFDTDLQTPPGAKWGTNGTYGLAVQTTSDNYFGLYNARHTVTDTMDADTGSGLNRETWATNAYGDTYTYFDAYAATGTYGVATGSHAENHYGLGYARTTNTTMTADCNTGLNRKTKADNSYGSTTTIFDADTDAADTADLQWKTNDGTYGMAVKIISNNYYGLGNARTNTTYTQAADTDTGLNQQTWAHNSYGNTTTYFDTLADYQPSWSSDGSYGLAATTVSENFYGLGNAKNTTTQTLQADTNTGLNLKTQAKNAYGVTTSYFDTDSADIADVDWSKWKTDGTYGMTVKTISNNFYGLVNARNTTTDTLDADTGSGLNRETWADNAYGDTWSYFDTIGNGTYGISTGSHAENRYGLGAARSTGTAITADPATGLNLQSDATNGYGETWSYFDTLEGGTSGVSTGSYGVNKFGLGLARATTTTITSDLDTGLNLQTYASNGYGETWSYFDTQGGNPPGTYGITTGSHAVNKFGMLFARTTDTTTTADPNTGLNLKSTAGNPYGHTTTIFDADQANFGTDLQLPNKAQPEPRWTTGDGTYGIAVQTQADNYFGLGKARHTVTDTLDADTYSGLNKKTLAQNDYGNTWTYFDTLTDAPPGTYGIARQSHAENHFGLGASRSTDTTITPDLNSGLNLQTTAGNAYGQTTTYFDTEEKASWSADGTYGMAVRSVSNNYYGLGHARTSTTSTLEADVNTGLNRLTMAHNTYGDTWTYFDTRAGSCPSWSDGTYGMASSSVSNNNYGLFSTRNTTTTTTKADTSTGLSKETVANNQYGVTTSYFDTEELAPWNISFIKVGGFSLPFPNCYGMVVHSVSDNYYGLGTARHTENFVTDADTFTGLNRQTDADNAYGHTTSYFDSLTGGTYGLATSTFSTNHYGLGHAAQTTTTTLTADTDSGLNKKTQASNDYGVTTSYFDNDLSEIDKPLWITDGTFGIVLRTYSINHYGINDTRNTTTDTVSADTTTGLNRQTEARNSYGTTETYYDTYFGSCAWSSNGTYGMVAWSEAFNHYGLGYARDTRTTIEDADSETGLNKRTRADNLYGTTWTYFDTDSQEVGKASWSPNGIYGLAYKSYSQNYFGMGSSMNTVTTTLEVDTGSGLNKETMAVNDYGTTWTYFSDDSKGQDTYGQQDYSIADTNFGTINERHSKTTFTMDPSNGLTKISVAKYGKANTVNGVPGIVDPPLRTVTTTYDANSTGTYGVAMKNVTHSLHGATGAQDTTTTSDPGQVDLNTGIASHSMAVNALQTTDNWLFDPQTGALLQSLTTNHYGAKMNQHVQTAYQVNTYTGLNESSYALTGDAGHYVSETWSQFDDHVDAQAKWLQGTGAIWNSTTKQNSGLCFINTQFTYTSYTVNDDGITTQTEADNNNGYTKTYNNDDGLQKSSDNYAYFGSIYHTHTDVNELNSFTGNPKKTTATSYTRATSADLSGVLDVVGQFSPMYDSETGGCLSTQTVTEFDDNGMVSKTATFNGYADNDSQYAVCNMKASDYDEWGVKKSSTTINCKDKDDLTHDVSSVVTSEFDTQGTAYHSKSTSNFGVNYGRVTDSYVSKVNDHNGLQQMGWSTNTLSDTTTWYDDMGRQYCVNKHNKLNAGEVDGYKSGGPLVTDNIDSQTFSLVYYPNGNPAETREDVGHVIGDSSGLKTHVTSQTYTLNDRFGNAFYTETYNEFGLLGQEHTQTNIESDLDTGMTKHTYTYHPSTGDYENSYFDETPISDSYDPSGVNLHLLDDGTYRSHGCVDHTIAHCKEDGTDTTTYFSNKADFMEYGWSSWGPGGTDAYYGGIHLGSISGGGTDFNTGQPICAVVKKTNTDSCHDYYAVNFDYNDVGQLQHSASTFSQNGHDGWEHHTTYDTHYYWPDNGCPSEDASYDDHDQSYKIKYYDHDGLLATANHVDCVSDNDHMWDPDSWTAKAGQSLGNPNSVTVDPWLTSTTQYHYTGTPSAWDPADPTTSTTTFGSPSDPFLITTNSNFGKSSLHGTDFNPRHQELNYPKAVYIKSGSVDYVLGKDNLPISATEHDNKGTEDWTLNGDYGFKHLTSRNRTNSGGSTFNETFHEDADDNISADVNFTGYMGFHSGAGTEKFTQTGIITSLNMTSDTALTENLTFTNDGAFIINATGTREDGMAVAYMFSVMGDITSSTDDKGLTTWDPSTHLRTQTTGSFGTFNYTYAGDLLQSIQGTSAKDGTMDYDAYWNMTKWTDSMGVSHYYTEKAEYKLYWTEATETFTDANGASWTGDVTYDTYGFYFKGEKNLKATQAKVHTKGADDLVAIDDGQEITFLKSDLKAQYTQSDTFTYHSAKYDTRGNDTLGNLKAGLLGNGNLKDIADVEITVNEDGIATADFSKIDFTAAHFDKVSRFQPHLANSSSVGDSLAPPPSPTYNADEADNPYYNGDCGYEIKNVNSWSIPIYAWATGSYQKVVPGNPSATPPVPDSTQTVYYSYQYLDHLEYHYSWTQANWDKASDGFIWKQQGADDREISQGTMVQSNNKITYSPVEATKADGMAQATDGASHIATGSSVGVTLGPLTNPTPTTATAPVVAYSQIRPADTLGTGTDSTFGDTSAFKSAGTLPPCPTMQPTSTGGNSSWNDSPVVSATDVPVDTKPTVVADTIKGAGAGAGVTSKLVPTPTPPVTAAKQALQAKLAVQFKGLGAQNAEAIAALALSKLTPQEIAAALAGSNEGAEALMGGLTNAYQALLGGTYQKSLLGSILDSVQPGSAFKAVKQAVSGSAAVSTGPRVEAQPARDARYAQVVRDSNGNITQTVGLKGEVSKFTYDASGKTETSLVGGVLTVKHYGTNNLLLSENSGGTSRIFAYTTDGQGQVASTEVKVHSAEGAQDLKYDAAGKLVSKEQNGVTQTYTYRGNRVVVAARNAQGVELVKKVYEGGRLVEKIDPSTHTQYTYLTDASGAVLGVSMKVRDKDGQTSFYKFNASGEMTGKAASGSDRFVKTEDNTAQEAMAFEAAKDLFSDKRMVGEKLDQTQLQVQPVQVPQQRH